MKVNIQTHSFRLKESVNAITNFNVILKGDSFKTCDSGVVKTLTFLGILFFNYYFILFTSMNFTFY